MNGIILLKWLTGHGLLFLLSFSIHAIPTPMGVTTILPEETESVTTTIGLGQTDNLNSSGDISFSRLLQNVTETSIIISVRTGKAVDDMEQPEQQYLQLEPKNKSVNIEEVENGNAPSVMKAKLSTEEERFIQNFGGNDSPPAPSTKIPNVPDSGSLKPKAIEEYFDSNLFPSPSSTKAPVDPRDKMIQNIFGGECTFKIWNYCNKIRFWGGNYLVPDKQNPGKMIVKQNKIRCIENPVSNICLRNGWTVARCHMLCMSQCNIEYRMNYDDVVLHQGDCQLPLLGRK